MQAKANMQETVIVSVFENYTIVVGLTIPRTYTR